MVLSGGKQTAVIPSVPLATSPPLPPLPPDLQAADISHSLQKHIKFALRLAGRKRTDSTTGVSYTPTKLHRGFSDPQVQLSTRRASERLYFKDLNMAESRSASPPPQPGSKNSELLPVTKLFRGPPLSPRTKKLFKSRSGKERELSKQERQELVAKCSASVEDSCTQLQAACRCVDQGKPSSARGQFLVGVANCVLFTKHCLS